MEQISKGIEVFESAGLRINTNVWPRLGYSLSRYSQLKAMLDTTIGNRVNLIDAFCSSSVSTLLDIIISKRGWDIIHIKYKYFQTLFNLFS